MKSITEVVQNLLKPYIDRNIETATGELGAKNLLPNAVQTSVNYGLTFTRNPDDSVTVTGNKNDGSSHSVDLCTSLVLKAGEYYLSDGLSNVDNINILVYDKSSGTTIASTRSRTSPAGFDLASDTEVGVNIEVRGATTVAFNYRLYPMLRPASIADDTYVPYAMTNRELTEEALDYETISSVTLGTVHYVVSFVCGYRHGNHYHVEVVGEYDGQISNATTVPFFKISGMPTVSENRRVGTVIIHDDTMAPACASLHTDGYIYQAFKSSVSSGNISFILDFYIK